MKISRSENINESIDYSGLRLRTIYLAGGCFWGVQAYMRRVKGVASTEVGYANGTTKDPTYEQVCSSATGHAETVRIEYAPEIISIKELLEHFFHIIDPTLKNRQGNDHGSQYRTGIYFTEKEDEKEILKYIRDITPSYRGTIVTEVEPLTVFYPAEEYHQSYLEKNPGGYCHIKF